MLLFRPTTQYETLKHFPGIDHQRSDPVTKYSRLPLPLALARNALLLLMAAALMGDATAGPSQPHFGSHPQGTHGQHTAQYEPVSGSDPGAPNPAATASPSIGASRTETSTAAPACPHGAREYRKSLLITAFPRRERAEANAGGLWGAEQALAERLGEHLARGNQLFQYQLIGQSLPEPSANSGQPIRQLAREHGTQLVLSGTLHDLGMARPGDALNPGLVTRARNTAVSTLRLKPEWDTRQRDFVLQLNLHDGHTGQRLHTRSYRLAGIWNPRRPERARFGTPAFWETDYGQKIEAVLAEAGQALNEVIRCQPLVARLDPPRSGATTLLHAGHVQGLQVGDRLPLHRISLRPIPGEYRQYSAHRLESGVHLRVEKVHPQTSEVRLEGATSLHGEHYAVTPGQAPSENEVYTWLQD